MKSLKSDMYSSKQRWKVFLLMLALFIVGGSLVLSNYMVSKIADKETAKAKQWAQAIQKKAELVRFSQRTFVSLRAKERERMQLIVAAQKTLLNPSNLGVNQDVAFALSIINGNKDIPVILLDDRGEVSQYKNIWSDSIKEYMVEPSNMEELLKGMASQWKKANRYFTLEVFEGFNMTYTYDESATLKALEKQSDSLIQAFNKDLISDSRLMPVILVDSTKKHVLASNVSKSNAKVIKELKAYGQRNEPIKIDLGNQIQWLFYDQSPEVKQLRWFPYIQFGLIALVVLIGYLVFSTFRRAEQNQVWAGMAKETAHQLGTPLSSLSAWVDLLEAQEVDKEPLDEMRKDLIRLEKVTDRFSKIGSETKLETADVVLTVTQVLDYLRVRLSNKIDIRLEQPTVSYTVPHNIALMEWVIENITKNAVDAMEGVGTLTVRFEKEGAWIHIELEDTGKGLLPNQFKTIFQPGYSTKKRGWGLGLSLAKRIVESYHKGKIYVLRSELGKGTTFRISLPL
jgi:signal transduction histidine kinase